MMNYKLNILLMAVMLVVNWKRTLIGMCVMPFTIFVIFKVRRMMRKRWQVVRMKSSNLNGYLHESLAGMRVTEDFAREPENYEAFSDVGNDIRKSWIYVFAIPIG